MQQTIKGIVFVPVNYTPGVAGDPPQYHEDTSGWQTPFGYQIEPSEYHSLEYTFVAPPVPLGDVEVRVEAWADLDETDEYATVYLNDESQGNVFDTITGSYDCSGLSEHKLTIAKADWISLVGEGDATFRVTTQGTCDYMAVECYGQGTHVRLHIRYVETEATPFIPGVGPSFIKYRSYQQHRDGNGVLGYLWAEVVWDPIRKHHVWQIACEPTGKMGYGGVARSPGEASAVSPGNHSFVLHVPYYYRPRLVRLTGSGDCTYE